MCRLLLQPVDANPAEQACTIKAPFIEDQWVFCQTKDLKYERTSYLGMFLLQVFVFTPDMFYFAVFHEWPS